MRSQRVAPPQKLHRAEALSVVLTDVEDGDDIRVRQPRIYLPGFPVTITRAVR